MSAALPAESDSKSADVMSSVTMIPSVVARLTPSERPKGGAPSHLQISSLRNNRCLMHRATGCRGGSFGTRRDVDGAIPRDPRLTIIPEGSVLIIERRAHQRSPRLAQGPIQMSPAPPPEPLAGMGGRAATPEAPLWVVASGECRRPRTR